jgi:cell division protein FtsN
MALDYKARPPTPRPKRRSGKPCGFWFVLGLVLGGFGVGLYLMIRPPIQAPAPGAAVAKAESLKSAAMAPTRFDFHDILPELEVVVSDNELAKPDVKKPEEKRPEDKKPEDKKPEEKNAEPAKKPDPAKPDAAKTVAAESGGNTYMVQIASLRTAADAERFKAQLAMQGIQAKVQTVTVNGKDTYHRVQAGPYQGKQAVNDVRGQLKAKGMDTIAIKLK